MCFVGEISAFKTKKCGKMELRVPIKDKVQNSFLKLDWSWKDFRTFTDFIEIKRNLTKFGVCKAAFLFWKSKSFLMQNMISSQGYQASNIEWYLTPLSLYNNNDMLIDLKFPKTTCAAISLVLICNWKDWSKFIFTVIKWNNAYTIILSFI